MGRAAIYLRVSTETQDNENQRIQLEGWAEQTGHTIVSVYEEMASGARRRERLDDLYDDARRRRFDIVEWQ